MGRAFTITWLAFCLALALALPQPPGAAPLGLGALAGAVLVGLGFRGLAKMRPMETRSLRRRARLSILALGAGVLLGAVLLAALAALAAREPALRARFAGRLAEPFWRPWALAFESSILEEVAFRLFAMTMIAWLAGRVLGRSRAAVAVALVLSALLFAAAHLPAWAAAARATPSLVGGVLLLNGAGGLLFGWVFWRWGLPYAILCHFAGDVVIQSLGPRLLA